MATGATITVKVTGVEQVKRKLRRVQWEIIDGREIDRSKGYRGRVQDVLELGAIPDDRLLAAAYLERFMIGCPDSLYEMKTGAMQAAAIYNGMRALGPKYQSLIDHNERARIAATIAAERAQESFETFNRACYEFSLELASAAESITERIGKIGIVIGDTHPVGSTAWKRDQLLWFGYPDWTPERVDDLLFRFYAWLPDEAIDPIYKLVKGDER